MSIKIVRSLPEEVWHRFVSDHPNGNIFHTPEMFQVFHRAEDHRPELWAAIKNKSVLALLLPVQITLIGGLLRHLTTRSVAYGSILCAPGPAEGEKALSLLLRTYAEEADGASLFTELRNLSNLSNVQLVLQSSGFDYEDHLNFLIDIGLPVNEVWSNIGSKSTRKNIKKALRQNQLEIVEVCNRFQVDACYDLFRKSYAHFDIPLADCSLFKAAFDILYPRSMVKFLLARVEETYVAASIALIYKGIIYGWYRGFDRTYSNYLPNDLMVWHILKWGAENGYNVFDFGGAGKPDEEYGPRKFKAKFGGKLVNYGRNIYVHRPNFLRFSQLGYNLFRRLL